MGTMQRWTYAGRIAIIYAAIFHLAKDWALAQRISYRSYHLNPANYVPGFHLTPVRHGL